MSTSSLVSRKLVDSATSIYALSSKYLLNQLMRGHSGRVVTLSPSTSEVGVRFLAWPQVGKLVVACRWSAVYSTEP